MAIKRLSKLRPVHVIWKDSTSIGRWQPLDEAKQTKAVVIDSIGYLVSRTRDEIIIVQSIDRQNTPNCAEAMTIPRKSILEIRVLGE